MGGRQSHVATLVERRSRYVCLVRVTGKDAQTVVQALTQHVQRLPNGLMATLTWDRGLELTARRTFSIATGVQAYFCDPRSPLQRGTSENINEDTNSLLASICRREPTSPVTPKAQLDAIARRLNTRPRKTLGSPTGGYTSGNRSIDRLHLQPSRLGVQVSRGFGAARFRRSDHRSAQD